MSRCRRASHQGTGLRRSLGRAHANQGLENDAINRFSLAFNVANGYRASVSAIAARLRGDRQMTIATKIAKQIAAAKALGAPLFSLDRLHAGALAAESASAEANVAAEANVDAPSEMAWFWVGTNVHDHNAEIIARAADAAFAFACCRHLPAELGEYRERTDANDLIIAGLDMVRQYMAAEKAQQ